MANTPDELEIEKLELQDAAAALRNDLDLIERRWSERLVISSPANLLFSKAQVLAFFRAGLVRMQSFERRVTRVVVDGDTAVATGSDTVVPLVGLDTGKTVFCSYMNCWNRENGEWRLLGRQVSVVGKMKPDGTFESTGN
jgi:Domain of unknown function (DUF4440)